jgi:hypothetical protein
MSRASYIHATDVAALHVMKPGDLEEPLDIGFEKQFGQYVAWDSLRRVSQCYASLLDRPDLDPLDAPVGPRAIEAALVDTLAAYPSGLDLKKRMLAALLPEFLSRVNLLYRDLTSFMLALGLLPSSALGRTPFNPGQPESGDAGTAGSVNDQATDGRHPPVTDEPEASAGMPRGGAGQSHLDALVTGIWMEYQEHGQRILLKLTWVSPMRSLFLWTASDGERAICMNVQTVTQVLANGIGRLVKRAGEGQARSETQAASAQFRKSA